MSFSPSKKSNNNNNNNNNINSISGTTTTTKGTTGGEEFVLNFPAQQQNATTNYKKKDINIDQTAVTTSSSLFSSSLASSSSTTPPPPTIKNTYLPPTALMPFVTTTDDVVSIQQPPPSTTAVDEVLYEKIFPSTTATTTTNKVTAMNHKTTTTTTEYSPSLDNNNNNATKTPPPTPNSNSHAGSNINKQFPNNNNNNDQKVPPVPASSSSSIDRGMLTPTTTTTTLLSSVTEEISARTIGSISSSSNSKTTINPTPLLSFDEKNNNSNEITTPTAEKKIAAAVVTTTTFNNKIGVVVDNNDDDDTDEGGGGDDNIDIEIDCSDDDDDDDAYMEERKIWQSANDIATNRTYYYNTNTKATQWAKPLCLANKKERYLLLEKERKQRDFFAAMEANILSSMATTASAATITTNNNTESSTAASIITTTTASEAESGDGTTTTTNSLPVSPQRSLQRTPFISRGSRGLRIPNDLSSSSYEDIHVIKEVTKEHSTSSDDDDDDDDDDDGKAGKVEGSSSSTTSEEDDVSGSKNSRSIRPTIRNSFTRSSSNSKTYLKEIVSSTTTKKAVTTAAVDESENSVRSHPSSPNNKASSVSVAFHNTLLSPSTSSSAPTFIRASLVRTISTMEDSVLKSLVRRVPSHRSILRKPNANAEWKKYNSGKSQQSNKVDNSDAQSRVRFGGVYYEPPKPLHMSVPEGSSEESISFQRSTNTSFSSNNSGSVGEKNNETNNNTLLFKRQNGSLNLSTSICNSGTSSSLSPDDESTQPVDDASKSLRGSVTRRHTIDREDSLNAAAMFLDPANIPRRSRGAMNFCNSITNRNQQQQQQQQQQFTMDGTYQDDHMSMSLIGLGVGNASNHMSMSLSGLGNSTNLGTLSESASASGFDDDDENNNNMNDDEMMGMGMIGFDESQIDFGQLSTSELHALDVLTEITNEMANVSENDEYDETLICQEALKEFDFLYEEEEDVDVEEDEEEEEEKQPKDVTKSVLRSDIAIQENQVPVGNNEITDSLAGAPTNLQGRLEITRSMSCSSDDTGLIDDTENEIVLIDAHTQKMGKISDILKEESEGHSDRKRSVAKSIRYDSDMMSENSLSGDASQTTDRQRQQQQQEQARARSTRTRSFRLRRVSPQLNLTPEGDIPNSTTPARMTSKPQLLRRNTCGTLYVGSTLSAPDQDASIKCVCGVYRAHILQSELLDKEMASEAFVGNNDDDPTNNSTSEYEMYKEEYRLKYSIFDDQDIHQQQEKIMAATTKRRQTFYRPQVAAMNNDRNDGGTSSSMVVDTVPSLEDITTFYREMFQRSQMESDCIIMSLIYVERLLKNTDGILRPRRSNWRSILFSCMVLASKVWDDLSMVNSDFSATCPGGAYFSIQRVNELEMGVLSALDFQVKVYASEYAKYYFLLRSMVIKSGLGSDGLTSLNQLDVAGARRLQHLSSQYERQESISDLKRLRNSQRQLTNTNTTNTNTITESSKKIVEEGSSSSSSSRRSTTGSMNQEYTIHPVNHNDNDDDNDSTNPRRRRSDTKIVLERIVHM